MSYGAAGAGLGASLFSKIGTISSRVPLRPVAKLPIIQGMGCLRHGHVSPARRWRRRRSGIVAACAVLGVAALPAPAQEAGGRIETHILESRLLESSRTLFVWVPDAHEAQPQRRFPLLLALNGENLFEDERALGGREWAVDELLAQAPRGIPPFVVVGVASAPHAVREYATPGSRPDAQADLLLRFLVEEVLPFLQENWRLEEDAASRYLLGMDNSAWAAVYGAWAHAGIFAGALAFGCPDVDTEVVRWPFAMPARGRPWLWLEQIPAERSRPSNSSLFAALRRGADVNVVVAGETASRPARLAAALRATPRARSMQSP